MLTPASSAAPSSSLGAGAPRPLSADAERWAWWALAAIAAAVAVRLGINALELAPLHFDEAQYWTYGEALDWGYYSKPPMAAWLIRLSTELAGDTIFGVRLLAPVVHGVIAWLLFATGRLLFDARTGFWAAICYLTLPAVAASSGLMTTDPPMMVAWALALYALARALASEPPHPSFGGESSVGVGLGWWALCGAAIGVGLLSKYTMVAFVGGCLGYALFSRQGRFGWRPTRLYGPLLAALCAVLAFSPNLLWNAANDFAAIAHVGDNAKLGGGPRWQVDKALEFIGAQAAILGPVLFIGLLLLVAKGRWRQEWSYRLLLWLTLPLPVIMTVQAFLSRAHPNWAAPAYVAGTLAIVAWLLDRERAAWLRVSVAIGLAAQVALTGAAVAYREAAAELPRTYDPYKKMRPNPPICARALALSEGAPLLSNDRRLLADCMFVGGLGLTQIRIWNADGVPGNHYEMTSSLTLNDADQSFLLVVLRGADQAAARLSRFEQVEVLESAALVTHADRSVSYTLARVSGFKGYADK
ncbi:MAG: glycosyltransferase family 39 protein [Rhodobacteraceae bacterium]|nr:glycosyltransferase family 39 protein [Paracoccaceae bacterium]